jgi:hypothetical protein
MVSPWFSHGIPGIPGACPGPPRRSRRSRCDQLVDVKVTRQRWAPEGTVKIYHSEYKIVVNI